MRPERIKQLRSSIRLVPELVRASMVTQAFELESLITATIDLSDGMEAALRSMPQSYRESLTKLYRSLMYKAYDAGYNNAQLKQGLFKQGESPIVFIRDKMPLPYSLEMTLLKAFTDDTATFLKTVEAKDSIYQQFKRDIEQIYCEGANEYLQVLPAPEAKEEEMATEVKEPAELKDETTAAKKAVAEDSEKPTAGSTREEIIRKLEDYANLVGTPEGSKVIRYYLGLPVHASIEIAKTIGSYEIKELRSKVLATIGEHEFTADDQQIAVIDSLAVSEAKELADALGIADLLPEEYSLPEAKLAADELAVELTASLDLPGTLMFADVDDSLVLAFSFKAKNFEKQVQAARKVKSELPGGPMGVLDEKDKKELEALHLLDRGSLKMLAMKDLKKVAPKVVDLISEYLTKTRNSEFKMGELSKLFSMPMVDVVEMAYNRDGAEYFKQCQKNLR